MKTDRHGQLEQDAHANGAISDARITNGSGRSHDPTHQYELFDVSDDDDDDVAALGHYGNGGGAWVTTRPSRPRDYRPSSLTGNKALSAHRSGTVDVDGDDNGAGDCSANAFRLGTAAGALSTARARPRSNRGSSESGDADDSSGDDGYCGDNSNDDGYDEEYEDDDLEELDLVTSLFVPWGSMTSTSSSSTSSSSSSGSSSSVTSVTSVHSSLPDIGVHASCHAAALALHILAHALHTVGPVTLDHLSHLIRLNQGSRDANEDADAEAAAAATTNRAADIAASSGVQRPQGKVGRTAVAFEMLVALAKLASNGSFTTTTSASAMSTLPSSSASSLSSLLLSVYTETDTLGVPPSDALLLLETSIRPPRGSRRRRGEGLSLPIGTKGMRVLAVGLSTLLQDLVNKMGYTPQPTSPSPSSPLLRVNDDDVDGGDDDHAARLISLLALISSRTRTSVAIIRSLTSSSSSSPSSSSSSSPSSSSSSSPYATAEGSADSAISSSSSSGGHNLLPTYSTQPRLRSVCLTAASIASAAHSTLAAAVAGLKVPGSSKQQTDARMNAAKPGIQQFSSSSSLTAAALVGNTVDAVNAAADLLETSLLLSCPTSGAPLAPGLVTAAVRLFQTVCHVTDRVLATHAQKRTKASDVIASLAFDIALSPCLLPCVSSSLPRIIVEKVLSSPASPMSASGHSHTPTQTVLRLQAPAPPPSYPSSTPLSFSFPLVNAFVSPQLYLATAYCRDQSPFSALLRLVCTFVPALDTSLSPLSPLSSFSLPPKPLSSSSDTIHSSHANHGKSAGNAKNRRKNGVKNGINHTHHHHLPVVDEVDDDKSVGAIAQLDDTTAAVPSGHPTVLLLFSLTESLLHWLPQSTTDEYPAALTILVMKLFETYDTLRMCSLRDISCSCNSSMNSTSDVANSSLSSDANIDLSIKMRHHHRRRPYHHHHHALAIVTQAIADVLEALGHRLTSRSRAHASLRSTVVALAGRRPDLCVDVAQRTLARVAASTPGESAQSTSPTRVGAVDGEAEAKELKERDVSAVDGGGVVVGKGVRMLPSSFDRGPATQTTNVNLLSDMTDLKTVVATAADSSHATLAITRRTDVSDADAPGHIRAFGSVNRAPLTLEEIDDVLDLVGDCLSATAQFIPQSLSSTFASTVNCCFSSSPLTVSPSTIASLDSLGSDALGLALLPCHSLRTHLFGVVSRVGDVAIAYAQASSRERRRGQPRCRHVGVERMSKSRLESGMAHGVDKKSVDNVASGGRGATAGADDVDIDIVDVLGSAIRRSILACDVAVAASDVDAFASATLDLARLITAHLNASMASPAPAAVIATLVETYEYVHALLSPPPTTATAAANECDTAACVDSLTFPHRGVMLTTLPLLAHVAGVLHSRYALASSTTSAATSSSSSSQLRAASAAVQELITLLDNILLSVLCVPTQPAYQYHHQHQHHHHNHQQKGILKQGVAPDALLPVMVSLLAFQSTSPSPCSSSSSFSAHHTHAGTAATAEAATAVSVSAVGGAPLVLHLLIASKVATSSVSALAYPSALLAQAKQLVAHILRLQEQRVPSAQPGNVSVSASASSSSPTIVPPNLMDACVACLHALVAAPEEANPLSEAAEAFLSHDVIYAKELLREHRAGSARSGGVATGAGRGGGRVTDDDTDPTKAVGRLQMLVRECISIGANDINGDATHAPRVEQSTSSVSSLSSWYQRWYSHGQLGAPLVSGHAHDTLSSVLALVHQRDNGDDAISGAAFSKRGVSQHTDNRPAMSAPTTQKNNTGNIISSSNGSNYNNYSNDNVIKALCTPPPLEEALSSLTRTPATAVALHEFALHHLGLLHDHLTGASHYVNASQTHLQPRNRTKTRGPAYLLPTASTSSSSGGGGGNGLLLSMLAPPPPAECFSPLLGLLVVETVMRASVAAHVFRSARRGGDWLVGHETSGYSHSDLLEASPSSTSPLSSSSSLAAAATSSFPPPHPLHRMQGGPLPTRLELAMRMYRAHSSSSTSTFTNASSSSGISSSSSSSSSGSGSGSRGVRFSGPKDPAPLLPFASPVLSELLPSVFTVTLLSPLPRCESRKVRSGTRGSSSSSSTSSSAAFSSASSPSSCSVDSSNSAPAPVESTLGAWSWLDNLSVDVDIASSSASSSDRLNGAASSSSSSRALRDVDVDRLGEFNKPPLKTPTASAASSTTSTSTGMTSTGMTGSNVEHLPNMGEGGRTVDLLDTSTSNSMSNQGRVDRGLRPARPTGRHGRPSTGYSTSSAERQSQQQVQQQRQQVALNERIGSASSQHDSLQDSAVSKRTGRRSRSQYEIDQEFLDAGVRLCDDDDDGDDNDDGDVDVDVVYHKNDVQGHGSAVTPSCVDVDVDVVASGKNEKPGKTHHLEEDDEDEDEEEDEDEDESDSDDDLSHLIRDADDDDAGIIGDTSSENSDTIPSHQRKDDDNDADVVGDGGTKEMRPSGVFDLLGKGRSASRATDATAATTSPGKDNTGGLDDTNDDINEDEDEDEDEDEEDDDEDFAKYVREDTDSYQASLEATEPFTGHVVRRGALEAIRRARRPGTGAVDVDVDVIDYDVDGAVDRDDDSNDNGDGDGDDDAEGDDGLDVGDIEIDSLDEGDVDYSSLLQSRHRDDDEEEESGVHKGGYNVNNMAAPSSIGASASSLSSSSSLARPKTASGESRRSKQQQQQQTLGKTGEAAAGGSGTLVAGGRAGRQKARPISVHPLPSSATATGAKSKAATKTMATSTAGSFTEQQQRQLQANRCVHFGAEMSQKATAYVTSEATGVSGVTAVTAGLSGKHQRARPKTSHPRLRPQQPHPTTTEAVAQTPSSLSSSSSSTLPDGVAAASSFAIVVDVVDGATLDKTNAANPLSLPAYNPLIHPYPPHHHAYYARAEAAQGRLPHYFHAALPAAGDINHNNNTVIDANGSEAKTRMEDAMVNNSVPFNMVNRAPSYIMSDEAYGEVIPAIATTASGSTSSSSGAGVLPLPVSDAFAPAVTVSQQLQQQQHQYSHSPHAVSHLPRHHSDKADAEAAFRRYITELHGSPGGPATRAGVVGAGAGGASGVPLHATAAVEATLKESYSSVHNDHAFIPHSINSSSSYSSSSSPQPPQSSSLALAHLHPDPLFVTPGGARVLGLLAGSGLAPLAKHDSRANAHSNYSNDRAFAQQQQQQQQVPYPTFAHPPDPETSGSAPTSASGSVGAPLLSISQLRTPAHPQTFARAPASFSTTPATAPAPAVPGVAAVAGIRGSDTVSHRLHTYQAAPAPYVPAPHLTPLPPVSTMWTYTVPAVTRPTSQLRNATVGGGGAAGTTTTTTTSTSTNDASNVLGQSSRPQTPARPPSPHLLAALARLGLYSTKQAQQIGQMQQHRAMNAISSTSFSRITPFATVPYPSAAPAPAPAVASAPVSVPAPAPVSSPDEVYRTAYEAAAHQLRASLSSARPRTSTHSTASPSATSSSSLSSSSPSSSSSSSATTAVALSSTLSSASSPSSVLPVASPNQRPAGPTHSPYSYSHVAQPTTSTAPATAAWTSPVKYVYGTTQGTRGTITSPFKQSSLLSSPSASSSSASSSSASAMFSPSAAIGTGGSSAVGTPTATASATASVSADSPSPSNVGSHTTSSTQSPFDLLVQRNNELRQRLGLLRGDQLAQVERDRALLRSLQQPK